MADQKLTEKLGDYVEDAHAMETNVLQMLDSMIATTTDAKVREELERHKGQTEKHEERLRKRLEQLGRSTSTRKEAQTIVGALMTSVVDQVRGDKPGKNARDGFVTEHMEIASYELLERLAERAGDRETAKIARTNRRDEEAMAKKIAGKWDKFVDLTLEEDGIDAPKPRRSSSTARQTTARTRTRQTTSRRR
jgi:ferritin-like metal-binding protein YciE